MLADKLDPANRTYWYSGMPNWAGAPNPVIRRRPRRTERRPGGYGICESETAAAIAVLDLFRLTDQVGDPPAAGQRQAGRNAEIRHQVVPPVEPDMPGQRPMIAQRPGADLADELLEPLIAGIDRERQDGRTVLFGRLAGS